MERFAARKKILEDLQAAGLLVGQKDHANAVGTCQRCTTIVEPRLSPQWFVKVKPMAEKAIEAVEQGRTRFVPESWTNTFYAWMRNIHDWCVSRQLWWGHQIPAWYPNDTSPRLPNGTIDFGAATPVVAREKPGVTPENPSGEWTQDPDVLDTWFSSGLWPFSTLGWPEKTPELKAFYPNSVMETGHDIIFFWVARMMMMGLHFMGDVPFRTVYLHAMVRDEKGEKMSKTKGNVIDPLDIVCGAAAANLPPSLKNKFPQGLPPMGADALRFTLASLTQQGRDIKLSIDRIAGYKAFANKIWNAARFAQMNLADFHDDGATFIKDRPLSLADRWILARLNHAVKGAQAALQGFQFAEAASILYQFLWAEFCDWYIELSKHSLYGTDESAKTATRAVLVFCLDRILRALHPFMPFITEEIWQKLPMKRSVESICLAAYPEEDRRLDDAAAEAEMGPIIEAIEGIRTIRGESNLSPAKKLEAHIQAAEASVRKSLEACRGYLMPLAGLSQLTISDLGPKPPQAAADIRPRMEIYVPLAGLVDLAEERERLKKEIGKAEAEIANLSKRLDNPSFVSRAPPEVVEKDTARRVELQGRVTKLGENMKRLAPAEVHIAPPASGPVDLRQELKAELDDMTVPAPPDPQVADAMSKLADGTKEGLTSRDHYDLGVAYMGMGLVDDAVREFNRAKVDEKAPPAEAAPKKASPRKTAPKKTAAKKKPTPKAKKAPSKKPAAKAKKAPAKKPAAKAKKAPAKKPAGKGTRK